MAILIFFLLVGIFFLGPIGQVWVIKEKMRVERSRAAKRILKRKAICEAISIKTNYANCFDIKRNILLWEIGLLSSLAHFIRQLLMATLKTDVNVAVSGIVYGFRLLWHSNFENKYLLCQKKWKIMWRLFRIWYYCWTGREK